jgi:hypothetical protein
MTTTAEKRVIRKEDCQAKIMHLGSYYLDSVLVQYGTYCSRATAKLKNLLRWNS